MLQLFGLCLAGDVELHKELAADLLALSRAQAQCSRTGVPQDKRQDVAQAVSKAVGALKRQANVEVLERRMELLRAEIAEQAAVAAHQHKFNYGPSFPSLNASQKSLALGLQATEKACPCDCF